MVPVVLLDAVARERLQDERQMMEKRRPIHIMGVSRGLAQKFSYLDKLELSELET